MQYQDLFINSPKVAIKLSQTCKRFNSIENHNGPVVSKILSYRHKDREAFLVPIKKEICLISIMTPYKNIGLI